MRKHCCRNILCQCYSQCCDGDQAGRKQKIFSYEMQLLHLQNELQEHANEERFKKHSNSVFPNCFLLCTSMQHIFKIQNLCLESKKFQNHFLLPGPNFVSIIVFPLFAPAFTMTICSIDALYLECGRGYATQVSQIISMSQIFSKGKVLQLDCISSSVLMIRLM